MAKMKRVVSSAANPRRSPNELLFDGSKTGLKNQKRYQDYQKLAEENEAKRKRLEEMKHKRSVLLAEVKFLRRRYSLLTAVQEEELNQTENAEPLQKPMSIYRKVETDKKSSPAAFRLKQKPKSSSGNDGSDHSKRQKGLKCKAIAKRIPEAASNMIRSEVLVLRKGDSDSKVAPVFDLNETWREEKELQAEGGEPLIYFRRGIGEEHLNTLRTSACRGTETGANRMDKRRISWQDPVALRV